jgi:hypothetical protein
MQLLTVFSQSMEMKIELMQQGGLEFLINQKGFGADAMTQLEENDTLQVSLFLICL